MQSEDEIDEGRLSAAGRTDDAKGSIFRNGQVQIGDDGLLGSGIGEAEMLEGDRVFPIKGGGNGERVGVINGVLMEGTFGREEFVEHFLERVKRGAESGDLAIEKLDRREQAVTRQGHHAKVRQKRDQILSPCGINHDDAHKSAEGEWFDEVAGCIGKDRRPGMEAGVAVGVFSEPTDEEFLAAMDLNRLDPGKHLLGLDTKATKRILDSFRDGPPRSSECAEDDQVEESQTEGGGDRDLRMNEKQGRDQQENRCEAGETVE